MSRITAAALALVFCGAGTGLSIAQTYPTRPIKLVVALTPGSPVDSAARVLAQVLQPRLGQGVVIENRPGAGTSIGAKAVAGSDPDGYTLLMIGTNIAYYPVLYPNLDFDPAKSLVPVATVASWSHGFVISPDVPARTVAELVAHAKANPSKLVFGYGLGTTPHILGATFREVTGVDITFLPYRGGEQARMDLLGGRVHINIAPVSGLLPLIQEGKMRPIAVTGATRHTDLPDVPTMRESGLPQVGYDPDTWVGILAPAGTPQAVVARLNQVVNESLDTPELKAALAKIGMEPMGMTQQAYVSFLADELKKWPARLRAAGLKPEGQ